MIRAAETPGGGRANPDLGCPAGLDFPCRMGVWKQIGSGGIPGQGAALHGPGGWSAQGQGMVLEVVEGIAVRKRPVGLTAAFAVLLILSAPLLAEGAQLQPPGRVTVPRTCVGVAYAVSWTASPSAQVSYQLQEATNAAFTAGLRIAYRGTGTRARLTGGTNGKTYYYRVRAVRSGATSSPWVAGTNGCLIARKVEPPSAVTVPAASTTGSYQVSWGASPTPGAGYQVQEATSPNFSAGLRTVYTGSLLTADATERTPALTYYYRVRGTRAGWTPSAWVVGGNGCVVSPTDITPPGQVSSFVATVADGQVQLSWGNPADADFAGVKVLRRTDRFPTAVDDGQVVYQGVATGCAETAFAVGTYYYAAFSFDAVPNYSAAATVSAVVAAAASCEGCHNGNPAHPLAPNVINGPLPGGLGFYNWYGTNATRQDGGHGDPQGRDRTSPPACADCHDISTPPGTHGDGILQSPFDGRPLNENTSHLKAIFFDTARTSPAKPVADGPWGIQVAFDNYCAYACHRNTTSRVTQIVPDMRHEADTAAAAPNHWSLEFGTHLTTSSGTTPPLGGMRPVDSQLNVGATGLPDYGTCVSCHDPHGTTVVETSKPSNRMIRESWGDSALCGYCHI